MVSGVFDDADSIGDTLKDTGSEYYWLPVTVAVWRLTAMQFYEHLLLTSQHNLYRADSIHIAQEAWGKMLRYCCTTCMHAIWGVVVIRAAPSLLQPSSCAASTSWHPAQECGQWTGKWTEHLIWPQLINLSTHNYAIPNPIFIIQNMVAW